jgi:phage replication-related protein YjqB (UPF0714/DUF867 family)
MNGLAELGRPRATECLAAAFRGTVKRALRSQSTLGGKREHCSLDPDRLASIGLVPGMQVRATRSETQYALYTVSETRREPTDTTVRMAVEARRRLALIDTFDATISAAVPHPTLSDRQAEEQSEFVERLDDDGHQQGLVALAPHGGAIERHTDRQAELVASLLGADLASAWRCRGFKADGGAFERWHITATEIHERSFPFLDTIASRGFTHAVAFHGFSTDGVLVGGAAPLALKQDIAAALECVLAGSTIQVRIARPSDGNDGDNPRNLVNRLTADRANGVQIEQSLEARRRFGQAIACAVAEVYQAKLSSGPCR